MNTLYNKLLGQSYGPDHLKTGPFKLWKFLSGFQIKIYTIFITVSFQVRSNTDKNKGKMSTTNILNDDHDYVVHIFFFNNDNVQTLEKISIGIANGHL